MLGIGSTELVMIAVVLLLTLAVVASIVAIAVVLVQQGLRRRR